MGEEEKKRIIAWGKAALIRAIKTFFQTMVACFGSCALLSEVDWAVVLSASAFAFIASIATSLAGLPEVEQK